MFIFPLPMIGYVDTPIATLLADPLLILKKFPVVKNITQVVPDEYLIETIPLKITNVLAVPKKIVIAYTVNADSITFHAPTDMSVYTHVDGWLEGDITAAGEQHLRLDIVIQLQMLVDPGAPSALLNNTAQILSTQLSSQFRENLLNLDFSNVLPV